MQKSTNATAMRKFAFILFLVFCLCQSVFSQGCPPNIDFESGDFSNWECFTGKVGVSSGKNTMTLSPSAPVAGRHEIISAASGNQIDPYGKFPTLCPYGGNYSIKLGNNSVGGEAEALSYTFTVPTVVDTFTFTYFYAVVFEDPGHASYEQPRFFVTAYDVLTGNLINCASFDYISNGAIPGFEKSPGNNGVLFKDWSPASLQFAGLGGRSVRLEFRTADCTLGGHFGYAYVDVGSGCSNILATAPYCKETNSLILNAPYGFKSYTWYNENFTSIVGNKQTLTLTPPPATTGTFHVDVIPYPGYGCRDTLQANVTPLPVPDTPSSLSEYTFCQFQPVSKLTATPTRGHDLLWYATETGGTPSTTAPVPVTTKAGVFTFYVTQKVLFGCESFRKKITVNVVPSPSASFTINKLRQCQNGNEYIFKSTSANLFNTVFTWDLGDGKNISSDKDSIINYTYQSAGNINVRLKVTNAGTCSTDKSIAVTLVPKPSASFNYPAVICEKETAVTIVNTSTVANGIAAINKWWWSINGKISQLQNPAAFIPDAPGSLSVKLVVTTAEGCSSDTNNTALSIHYRPVALFKFSTPLCDNETLHFTNLSFVPQPSAESVVRWSWKFDNTFGTTLQHPDVNLAKGLHTTKLVAESNFGCKSPSSDTSFTINAKPQIRLDINDSCVFRIINYQAVDLAGSVNKWYWNFGSGFYTAGSLITKSYTDEGYRPFTLMAQTIYGCKDTIIRPFTIYDNKAFAGRDTITAMSEPVQLNAHGGINVKYTWTPAIGLSNPAIENPIAVFDKDQLYRLDAVTDKGCDSHSTIMIKRFLGPQLYIPTAFTPNGDGVNDVLRVFAVGMKSFNFFSVYNRAGQQIFYTTDLQKGWDGTFKGNKQDAGTYIVYATATDYAGKPLIKKSTVIIIR